MNAPLAYQDRVSNISFSLPPDQKGLRSRMSDAVDNGRGHGESAAPRQPSLFEKWVLKLNQQAQSLDSLLAMGWGEFIEAGVLADPAMCRIISSSFAKLIQREGTTKPQLIAKISASGLNWSFGYDDPDYIEVTLGDGVNLFFDFGQSSPRVWVNDINRTIDLWLARANR